MDLEFLVTAVFFAAQDDCECFGSAGLQLVQVVDVQFLEHRGNNAWNTGEVGGEGVEEPLYDNWIFAIRLDVKRNGGRTRGVSNVRVAFFVIVDKPSVDGMNESLGVTCRNRDSRFVVGFEIVEIKTDLMAFDAGEHAVTDERLRVTAVIAESIELCLTNAPAAGFEEFCRRRAFAGCPVAIANEAFQYLGFFATDFFDPRMFVVLVVCYVLVE